MDKVTKRLVTIEFRYYDRPINEDFSGYNTCTITVGVYDTLDEAIEHGNKAIELLSKYFEVRSGDRFMKNHLFGTPKTLVTNCCYPIKNISYFAKITSLHYDNLLATIQKVFEARNRYEQYLKEQEDE